MPLFETLPLTESELNTYRQEINGDRKERPHMRFNQLTAVGRSSLISRMSETILTLTAEREPTPKARRRKFKVLHDKLQRFTAREMNVWLR